MYREEKIINGILCYRNKPDEDFMPYTLETLSLKYKEMEKQNVVLRSVLKEIEGSLNKFF